MIKLRLFRKALKRAKRIDITETISKDTYSVEKAVFDMGTKEFQFIDVNQMEGIDFVINQCDISSIIGGNTSDDEFVFLINLKGGKQYRIKFTM